MAKPLKSTPILEGKDKEKFLKDLSNVKYNKKKALFLKECKEILTKIQKDI